MSGKPKYFRNWLPGSPWEWGFFACFSLWCFWPYRMTPIVTLKAVALSVADLTIAGCALFLLPVWMSARNGNRSATRSYLLFCTVVGWASISVLWADPRRIDVVYYLYPVVMGFFSATVGYLYSRLLGEDANRFYEVTKRLCAFLVVAIAVYAGESLFAWGLRSEAGFTVSQGFGTHRLRGPLGGASTIHIVILPALGFCLGAMIRKGRIALPWAAAALALVVSIFLTGSRAALAGLFLLLAAVVVHRASLKMIAVTAATVGLAVWMLSARVTFVRFYSFEDGPRTRSYVTSLEMATDSIETFLFGLGYGSVWPWYKKEMDFERHGRLSYFENITRSDYGKILYHPHSLFLGVLVELGFLCLFVISLCLFKPLIYLRRARSNEDLALTFLLFGLISTLPTFLFDYYLFKNWKISAVWWVLYFAAIRAASGEADRGGTVPLPPRMTDASAAVGFKNGPLAKACSSVRDGTESCASGVCSESPNNP